MAQRGFATSDNVAGQSALEKEIEQKIADEQNEFLPESMRPKSDEPTTDSDSQEIMTNKDGSIDRNRMGGGQTGMAKLRNLQIRGI